MGESAASENRQVQLSELSVLAVDDNATALRLLSEVLRASGVGRVERSLSGEDALAKLSSIQPDILCVDIPVMQGGGAAYRVSVVFRPRLLQQLPRCLRAPARPTA